MNENAGNLNQAIGGAIETALELDPAGRRRRGRRWIYWLAAALGIVAIIAWGLTAWFGGETTVAYRTAEAARGDLVIEISATGTLNPLTTVDISSEMSGVVREVPVNENQRVKAGDMVARLDTVSLSAQVDRATAQVKSAEAQLENARVTLRDAEDALTRAGTLGKRGLISSQEADKARSDRDRAVAALSIAEAAVAVAGADLKLKQADLAKSEIRSPIDGMVLTRSVDPGQTIAASLSAPVLFVIAENLERMKLEAAIDEADIGQVAIGQKSHFTVDTWPDRIFEATVSDIAYASTTADNVVSYKATLDVDNSELLLRPGMTATVVVVIREARDVVTVPNEAFRFTPPQTEASNGGFSLLRLFMPRFPRSNGKKVERNADGTRTLYVLKDGAPEAVKVRPGASDGERTEILSGLDAGAVVIVGTVGAAK